MPAKAQPARTRVLMDGIKLGESTRWHDGRVWFGDWLAETLYSVGEGGDIRTEAKIASLPFSIDWLPDGQMLVVNARTKALERREADGRFVTHADLSDLSEYGCNEIVVDGRSNVYVNNVNFDFPEGELRPGFVALLRPDGTLVRVGEGLAFPNGMVVTPDNKTLIVAESFNANLTAFDIAADGMLSNQRVWAHIEGQGADGICLDAEGCVWASSGPRCIRIREGGEVLDEIPLEAMAFACMLGGADGKTLFINQQQWTGDIAAMATNPTGRLVAARVDVPHAGFPRN